LWNDEQRREEKAEQCVQPDERDVECAEAKTNPECAERTVRFQARLLDRKRRMKIEGIDGRREGIGRGRDVKRGSRKIVRRRGTR
jgi:hypothetical protein